MAEVHQDNWDVGIEYDKFMGRWSKPLAVSFLSWLGIPEDMSWLEIGCGTGSLSATILDLQNPKRFLAIDPSNSFIEHASSRNLQENTDFKVGTGNAIPASEDEFDVVTSGLVLNFIENIPNAVEEMKRVTKQNGVISGYVWDYAGKMEMLRYFWDAAIELDLAAKELDEGERFPICDQSSLIDLLNSSELSNIQVESISINMHFKDFEDYWNPFLGKQGPAPSYVNGRSALQINDLKELLRSSLPIREDGSFALLGQAWAFRAVNS